MPDLQTEIFTKVLPTLRHNEKETTMDSLDNLKFDDDTDTAEIVLTQESELDLENNVTHRIVDYYMRHTSSDAVSCANAIGVHRGAVSTRLAQLVKRGYFVVLSERSENNLTVYQWAGKPFNPMSRAESMRRAHAARNGKGKGKASKKVHAALAKARAAKAAKREAVVPRVQSKPPITGRINVDELPVAVARDLYDQLRKVFGGAA